MTELPKSVRDQLTHAQVSATPHPEADLLTAYSENSLGPAERQRVTEHVAVCAECREVLFLALPELEPAQVIAKPAATRRFAWMAWASVAAVLVVVGSAVVLRLEKVTKIEPPPLAATEIKAPEPKVAEMLSPGPTDEKKTAPATKTPTRAVERGALVGPAMQAAPIIAAGANKDVVLGEQKQKEDALKAVTNEAVQNSQGIVGGKQIPPGPANTANVNVANVYAPQNTAPIAAPMRKAQRKAELGRDAATPATALGYAQSRPSERLVGRAHWRISNSGALERSYFDDEWKPVLVGAGVTFRVISVIGNVVWAGGNHGALYVSRNGGIDWAPVKIDSTADVVSIHFDDEMNGRIQTTDGKGWKTSNGGNSWTAP